jgi:hypothetical protein
MQIGVPNVNMWKLKGIGCEPPTLHAFQNKLKESPMLTLIPNKTMFILLSRRILAGRWTRMRSSGCSNLFW